ncbi:hypothetical protein [Natronoglomus mannanivorans]|uniref:Uncharacterized protein n=1 Tax=Natronoglomus mannanivorans TaxID=2979990 RepID=A0AAP2Z5T3_9EURY|nr:hypothetical protein [Halobacteria archaeon AArc-xg1-1]
MDRVDGEVGAYERESIRNIAVDTVKRNRANRNIIASDLIESGDESADRANKAYSRLMKDTTQEMEKLGLLEDGPAMTQAEAQAGWMDQIDEATDESDSE